MKMEQWVVYEFVIGKAEDKDTVQMLTTKELLEILAEEGQKPPKERRALAVYEVGECVIDWS